MSLNVLTRLKQQKKTHLCWIKKSYNPAFLVGLAVRLHSHPMIVLSAAAWRQGLEGRGSLLPDGWLSSLPPARGAWRTRGPGGDGIDPDHDAPGRLRPPVVRIFSVWRGSTDGRGVGALLRAWVRRMETDAILINSRTHCDAASTMSGGILVGTATNYTPAVVLWFCELKTACSPIQLMVPLL